MASKFIKFVYWLNLALFFINVEFGVFCSVIQVLAHMKWYFFKYAIFHGILAGINYLFLRSDPKS